MCGIAHDAGPRPLGNVRVMSPALDKEIVGRFQAAFLVFGIGPGGGGSYCLCRVIGRPFMNSVVKGVGFRRHQA